MMKFWNTAAALLLAAAPMAGQEGAPEKIDLKVLHQIKSEAFQRSQVMDDLFYIADVYGPRVNGSPNHRAAAEWIMTRLKSYGLQNVHLEPWGPFGNSWQYKKFYGALVEPNYAPLVGFPLAWTPGTGGPVTAEAVLAPIHTQADFEKYRGKLKGKIVLIADPKVVLMHTEPEARRLTDEKIEARTLVPDPSRLGAFGGGAPAPARGGRGGVPAAAPAVPPAPPPGGALKLRNDTSRFLSDEGALVAVNYGTNGDGGTVFASFGGSQDPKDPVPPPMVAITPEHYNRIARLIQHGMAPKVTFDIEATTYKDDPMGFNVVGEIPGASKKDEIVMLGGHLDSWQGGTGATDNGTGTSVAMDAVRILMSLHKPMARTVRITLWGGEEEGLLGSKAYVQEHFAPRDTMKQTKEYAKLDAYYNDDSGRFRGISADGNDEIAAIFKQWAAPIRDLEFQAVAGATAAPTLQPGGTDSTTFSWVGLDGFGFQQDPLEYGSRTHHSNMDLYDRVQAGDVMQGSAIEAWFVYNTATRAEMLPRLDTPSPLGTK